MNSKQNPFEFATANDLPEEMILKYYIEDYNYSRFIASQRNVLLVGERGCGKSMTLLYNSWQLQRLKLESEGAQWDEHFLGVYVPCNTPLIHKQEYELLEPLEAAAVAEHFFALSIAYALAETLSEVPGIAEQAEVGSVRARMEYLLGDSLPEGHNVFRDVMDYVDRSSLEAQRTLNDKKTLKARYANTFTFASLIMPLLRIARTLPQLTKAHFLLLIDDAHDLNSHQMRALCSWIAFRDHSLFSFKVAIASLSRTPLQTASGGSILEGHDYLLLDMVQPFQNEASAFGKLAHALIDRRLRQFGIERNPEDFFPISKQLHEDLLAAEVAVREEAAQLNIEPGRALTDYVYKNKRAKYFRSRSPNANRPEYSGFQTLVYLSTGVIRNLLQPCYWMYDRALSEAPAGPIEAISPGLQSDTILERSRKLWEWLRDGIDQNIVGCSQDDARRAYQLLDQLMILFRQRLQSHKSEPCAVSFSVSGMTDEIRPKLGRLFDVLRQAQLLYVRSGSAKDRGRREWYYIPNRLLLPDRGLDPHGQFAKVPIPAFKLWAAAEENRAIKDIDSPQMELFDEGV